MYIFLIIIILFLWIYHVQLKRIDVPKVFLDDLLDKKSFKTGDLILFKALNNYNSVFHGSYFGHVGIIWVNEKNIPYLFEANGIEKMALRDHHEKSGIFLTPAKQRIQKYKGHCYYKKLNKPLSEENMSSFHHFIDYALKNMYYDTNICKSGIQKIFGSSCNKGTNCGEIVYLSLIKLGLLDHSEYYKRNWHHLLIVAGQLKLLDGYEYQPLIEVVDHPFAE